MFRRFLICALLISAALATTASAQQTVEVDTLTVTARSLGPGRTTAPVEAVGVARSLAASGLSLITKGWFLGQDVQADGMARGAFGVTIDGERQYHACPNRMDAAFGRVNLLDVSRVDVLRDGAGLGAGLGGEVAFKRRKPGRDRTVRGYLTAGFDRSSDIDSGLSYEDRGVRATGRWFRGESWLNAEGESFRDLYGYAVDEASTHAEGSLQWEGSASGAGASYAASREVLHPYLLMDERESDHLSVSGHVGDVRLYVNHIDHLMDNGLRTSTAMSLMTTDASNTVLGARGEVWELWARHWDADNEIIPAANPAMAISNHMLPDVWRIGGGLTHRAVEGLASLHFRLGLVQTRAGDAARIALHREVHPDARAKVWSFPFSVGVGVAGELAAGLDASLLAEVVGATPEVEELYIGVRKPGGKPTWVGNPCLNDPVRATLRGRLVRGPFSFEAFASHVTDRPEPAKRMVDEAPYQTFEPSDVVLAGAGLGAAGRLWSAKLSWQWGEHDGSSRPVAEIPPLRLDAALSSPAWRHAHLTGRWTHAWEQSRIDPTLDEDATPAWDRLDLDLQWMYGRQLLVVSLENVGDELVTNHLSYQRNPFASGLRVWEAGRTVRVRTEWNF